MARAAVLVCLPQAQPNHVQCRWCVVLVLVAQDELDEERLDDQLVSHHDVLDLAERNRAWREHNLSVVAVEEPEALVPIEGGVGG